MSQDTPVYLDPASKPYPFCPGCSHATVLDRLGEALAQLRIPHQDLVLVSDIGCIGMSDKHFTFHTFHGLHGRSITYACGLKLARPELTVMALLGDGGLGIGGHHFLHAARRNVGIKAIVCNNFNFGMTGGQHSVTTPHEAITATTSVGNCEYPLDVCGLAQVARCGFAARAMFYDKELTQYLVDAIRNPGFAVVEVWEMCTAYFAKSNKVSKSWFEETLAARGLRKGILVNDPRPDYVTQYREGMKSLAGRPVSRGGPLVPRYRSPIDRRTSLLIAGRAGQKVRSTAITLGRAAVASGLYAVQRDDYPVTVMTGHSTAEMILQPTPIDALGVDCPDFVLLTAEEGKQVVRDRLAGLPETAVVCTVPELMPIETRARVEVIPVKELGLDAKKTQTVLASVAWFLARTGMIPLDALDEAATAGTKAEIAQENGATISAVRRQVIPA